MEIIYIMNNNISNVNVYKLYISAQNTSRVYL